jgi:hypothetical protein
MNASAVYSKSGKGVQEASGKTSHLSRSDRAVLSAIDGRATLADVAQKVGKAFDHAFVKVINELDKGGFIREVAAGVAGPAPASGKGAGAKPAATSAMDAGSDLDFTTVLSMPRGKPAPPPSQTQPTHTAPVPPPPPPPTAAEKVQAQKSAQEQQDAFARAREEAERKAAAERERVKAEAEAKMRAEQESKLRAEAEAKLKAEAEAKAKAEAEAKIRAAKEAAAKAAAEAKAKAEAEAKRAREEAERARKEAEAIAERARKEAEEKAERARREAEEKARREHDELKRKLEEERRAREEAERRAQEEAKRLEEERRKLEEERAQRRIQEQRELAARRRQEAEEEEKPKRKQKEPEPLPELPKAQAEGGGGFSDTLLADLESFTTRDDKEQKEREEAARKEKESADAREKEAAAQRAKDEAARHEREQKEARKREAAERKAREEAELREREERDRQRVQEEEERRRREAEERAEKAKEEERRASEAMRVQAFDAAQRAKRERDLLRRAPRTGRAQAEHKGWGKPIAVTLFLLLVLALAVAHFMPIDTSEYERAATDALGRPVKIGSANLSLVTGLELKFRDVSIGEGIRIAELRAFPELDALTGPRKAFRRIEAERLKLAQDALGPALFVKLASDTFGVGRVVLKNVELTGPLVLPKGLEFDLHYDSAGVVRSAFVRGPEALLAKLSPRGSAIEAEMSAASFTLPFAPEISLSKFSMKGAATPQGMTVSEWDGAMLNGTLSGTANVRWGESWVVDGIVTARNINAAVFAPALLSDGKAEGSGKFSMRGQPGKLAAASRLDGTFTVTRGVLGSIDLSRAIQTGGRVATGQTQFAEMNGQATYDRGAVSLRNVSIGAGQLSAGASADISQSGALSGRIVADVKIAQQRVSATLSLGGTVKEPQVRN